MSSEEDNLREYRRQRNESYLSPDDGARTPPRILSNQSLAGEDIVSLSRLLYTYSSDQVDVAISPFTPSEATNTPPSLQFPTPLSPPPLNVLSADYYYSSQPEIIPSGQSVTSKQQQQQQQQATGGRTRPPRVPQVALHPTTPAATRTNNNLETQSNADHSSLSALTESSSLLDYGSMPKRRTVSLDMNDPTVRKTRMAGANPPGALTISGGASHKSTPASILQPILLEDATTSRRVAPPESIFATNYVQKEEAKQAMKISKSVVTLQTDNLTDVDVTPDDTGSFVLTSDVGRDLIMHSPPQPPKLPSKRYSLQDVLDATPRERGDEVQAMKEIGALDARTSTKSHKSLLPLLSDDRIHDFQEETDDTKSPTPEDTKDSEPLDNFITLTKKLIELSSEDKSKCSKRRPDRKHFAGEKMVEAAAKLFKSGGSISVRRETSGVEHGQESGDMRQEENQTRRGRFFKYRRDVVGVGRRIKGDVDYFVEFLEPRRATIRQQIFRLLRLEILPALTIAALLYYVFDNPPTGIVVDTPTDAPTGAPTDTPTDKASASWWVLFIGVRQVITLGLARLSEVIVIDFLTFRTRAFPIVLGTTMSLIVAQSKGWPFQLFAWALIDLLMLYGSGQFAHHWAYWQDFVGMMNASNPSGSVTSSDFYGNLLLVSIGLSAAVSIKRFTVGNLLGKRVVVNYRDAMVRLMKVLILLREVAYLSTRLSSESARKILDHLASSEAVFPQQLDAINETGTELSDSFVYSEAPGSVTPTGKASDRGGSQFHSTTEQMEIANLLDEWEEPELQGYKENDVTMASILQFRRALQFISDDFPFSPAFGSARTRERCIQSAQTVFERLTENSPDENLDFETLCFLAKRPDGGLDRAKVKELIRLFRPNRVGRLNKLEFVKSVDSVYKTLRLLLASISNSSQIDHAYESIINVIFYIVAFFVFFGVLGVNIKALFVGFLGLIVSFAFMIGSASSKYVEGILFVLVRKPYDIGDRIAISPVDEPASSSSSWIVEKVDLYTTTVRLGSTREVATLSNGSMAGLRIINMKRSEKPNIQIYSKFGVDVTSQQIKQFRKRMTAYAKERPREWISLCSFRCTRVETDLGYIEYVIVLQHREAWQNLPAILESKGNFCSYGLEVQKELDMKYTAPRRPIDVHQERASERRDSLHGAPPFAIMRGESTTVSIEGKKDR